MPNTPKFLPIWTLITLTDSNIKPYNSGDGGLYMANWHGFTISTRVDKNDKLVNKYGIITKQAGYMDEIALSQYHDLVQYLIRISNPKLSIDEVQLLVDKSVNFYSFMIMEEDGYKRVTNPSKE